MNLPEAPHVELTPMRLEQLKAFVVREAEKRPRPAPFASRRTRTVVATAALVAAIGTWQAVSLISGAPPASAAWAAVPAPLAGPEVAQLARTCTERLPVGTTPGGMSAPVSLVLAERRGTTEAVLMGGVDSTGVCLEGTDFWAAGRVEAPTLKEGQVLAVQGNGGNLTEGDSARYVYGRVDPAAAAAVTVDTSDERRVTATVKDGYFFAWWPSTADPVAVTAADAVGSAVDTTYPKKLPQAR